MFDAEKIDEIKVELEYKINNDEDLNAYDKITHLHSVSHEIGHLRTAIKEGFHFSYIRVNRYVYYVDQSLCLHEFTLDKLQYNKIRKKYGQCVVFAEVPTKKAYISFLNAGPKATTTFKEQIAKQSILFQILFNLECSFWNPEMDSALHYNLIAMIGRSNNDQNLIKKSNRDQNFHKTLNERFKKVHSYIIGKEDSLPKENISEPMRVIANAIRERERREKNRTL